MRTLNKVSGILLGITIPVVGIYLIIRVYQEILHPLVVALHS